MVKIDRIDRRIVDLLLKDSRMSNAEIGKKAGLSHDAVRYRIDKLVRDRVIKNFSVEIDHQKLGLQIWADVIISVWNLTPKRYAEFVAYLKGHPNIAAVWNLSGRYEWFIEVFAPDLDMFNELTTELKIKFSDIIKDFESAFVLKEVKPYSYPV